MARELHRAAACIGELVAEHDALVKQIGHWEAGRRRPTERYLLLYHRVFPDEWPANGAVPDFSPDPAVVLERARAAPGPADIDAMEEAALARGAPPDAGAALFAGIRDLERQLAALRELAERLYPGAADDE